MRIAIIGAGGIAARHVEQLTRIANVRITAVVDISVVAATRLCSVTGAKFYLKLDDALPHFDAAYVLTPPGSRVEVIRTLAAAGKAVFCEKPIATNLADAIEITDLVTSSEILFMMGFTRRWHPPYKQLKSLIDNGACGRPLQLFRQRIGYLPIAKGNWRIDARQLCGLTIESVSHDIDLMRWLGGEISSASGVILGSRDDVPGYDDTMAATLRFTSGATGVIHVSWASLVERNECGVIGSSAAAVIRGSGMWASESIEKRGFSDELQLLSPIDPGDANEFGYRGENRSFIDLLLGRKTDYPTVYDGLRALEISLAIVESSRKSMPAHDVK